MTTDNFLTPLTTSKSYYVQGGTGAVFPTYQAFSIFLRRHAKELCEDGAYIPRQGSAGSLVDPQKIDSSIRSIMHREGALLASVIDRVA